MKKGLLIVLSICLTLWLAGCQALDVIGTDSLRAFQAVVDAMPEGVAVDQTHGGFSLSAPDDSARLIWRGDYSESAVYDILLEFPAKPFLDAGLDVGKLPERMLTGENLIVGANLSDTKPTAVGEPSAVGAFSQIVKLRRDLIKYHADMDHFGVSLDNGNLFEWAKDMAQNDKDIVFALNPQVFIDAGVDPAKVAGWVFAKVKTMEDNGRKVEMDKFLKPFNLQ